MKKTISQTAKVTNHIYPVDSPIANKPQATSIVPWELGVKQKIQSKFLRTSGVNIKNFIEFPAQLETTASNVLNGAGVLFRMTITATPPHQGDPLIALPLVQIYQGLNGSALVDHQIYPYVGGSINTNWYAIQSGYDGLYSNMGAGTLVNSAQSLVNSIVITNNSGTTQTLYFFSQWVNILYNNTAKTVDTI